MRTANHFLKYLVAISLVAGWIGCQAYPEHHRLIEKKRETLKTNVIDATEKPCEKLPLESEKPDDKATSKKPRSNVKNEEAKQHDETIIQVISNLSSFSKIQQIYFHRLTTFTEKKLLTLRVRTGSF